MSRRDAEFLETVLRGMDTATAEPTRTAEDLPEHARADLDRILSTARDIGAAETSRAGRGRRVDAVGGSDGSGRPGRRRGFTPRRWALAAAAAVLLAGGLAVPVVTAPAYAGWQQVPRAVDAAGTERAAQACREMWTRAGVEDLAPGFAQAADFRSVLSERRGPYTFTVMRGPQGQFADCMMEADWFGFGLGNRGGGGSMTPVPPTPPPAADHIDMATNSAVGPSRRSMFGITLPGDAQTRNFAYGRAAADVVAVTLHTRAQGDVQASMQGGLWAAWWPSPAEDPEIEGVTATLTLRDGSTRQVGLDPLNIPWPGRHAD